MRRAAIGSPLVSREAEARILELYEAGRLGEAQAIILEELERGAQEASEKTKAYEEGFKSGRTTEVTVSGATSWRPFGLNPYGVDTAEYASWNAGFYDGHCSREKG